MFSLLEKTKGYQVVCQWLTAKNRHPFVFQQETWQHINAAESGLVNAPTGCGKTFSVFLGAIISFINQYPDDYKRKSGKPGSGWGLQLLWVTPLRALAKDIARAMEEVVEELGVDWKIGIRNGDTSTIERARQKKQLPEVLLITPESLHLLFAQKNYPDLFSSLKIIAVDEWHELLGSKRGVQVELAIARLLTLEADKNARIRSDELPANNPAFITLYTKLCIWGISATIGNLEEAMQVLLTPRLTREDTRGRIVRANLHKQIEISSIIPDEREKYPWAGHLGLKLIDKVLPVIYSSQTTLIFINTRGMSERWYQSLLTAAPDLAGAIGCTMVLLIWNSGPGWKITCTLAN